MSKTEFILSEQFLIGSLGAKFEKIISTSGTPVQVSYVPSDYVATGGLYTFASDVLKLPIWVGLNGPRFFFISYVDMRDAEEAKKIFSFCFGGAERVGWGFSYERVNAETLSIWGTLMTDKSDPLVKCSLGSISVTPELTREGHFWLTDIGLMAQSFFRTCERFEIHAPSDLTPAPL
jgi:hypothetical protein